MSAAISRSLTTPDQRVDCLSGDGGFAKVIQELETTVRSGAKLTVVVKNNSNMHFIKDDQRLFFDGRYIFTEFTELDYAEIARAFGCVGIRVENSGEPDSALSDAMHDNETVVIDVRIPDDAVSERVSLQSVS